jgi:hypothetical protein
MNLSERARKQHKVFGSAGFPSQHANRPRRDIQASLGTDQAELSAAQPAI